MFCHRPFIDAVSYHFTAPSELLADIFLQPLFTVSPYIPAVLYFLACHLSVELFHSRIVAGIFGLTLAVLALHDRKIHLLCRR